MSSKHSMQALAAEPWEAPTFFRTPIDTLLESTEDISFDNISHHDLSDAYNTFSLRLRTITKAMTEREGTLPALGLVKQHATAITKCLRRDIRLALIDPFPEPPPANIAIPNSITSSTRDITDEEMEAARDYASVSHSALHLTANVFKFATFSACFPHDDVCALLDCVIEIALDPALPTPSSRKTTALAVWVLGNSHRLQGPLSQRRHRLTRALGRIIVSTGPTITVIDALKTVFNILVAQPALFLDPFGALVPQILDCLISPTPSIRIQAAHTLSGFVLALTQCTNNGARKAVYEHVQTFLDYQLSFRRKQSSGTLRLGDLISAALSSEQPRDPGQGAPWALVVLACVVVFSGSSIFTHPRALKLVIHSLTKTATHRRSVVRTLHASLWKCLVWAFANIGQNNRSKEEADAAKETREPAFLVVKQELVGGVGAVLVSSLLSHYVLSRQPDDAELTKALIVVKDMVKHESSTIHAEGVSILTRLISSIGCSSPDPSRSSTSDTSPEFKILTKELFDGTILTSPWERLSTLAPTFCKFDLENIRQLCEAEIERRWEDLISIWVICVQRSLSAHTSAAPLSTDLLHVWQALLLVQTQLTQERGHLTTPPEFASRAVAIIDILLAMTKPDVPGSSHVGDTQRSVLTLTLQLWKIMKNVFAASWLTPTAGSILMVVFKREYVLEREDVKIAWSELCAALIRSNAPGLLSTLDVSDDHQGEQEIRRHVWRTLADRWSKFYKPSWQDTVSLLVFPFGSWDMSDRELAVWDGIVGYATSQADSSLLVIEALVSRIVETSERLSAYPKPILALLSHIRLTDVDDISAKLLGHLDKFLLDIYSTDSELSHLRSTMLPAFSTMFALCPPSKLVQIIAALSRGLCIWINDKLLVFSDDGYNDTVMTFYRDTLKLLRDHTLTLDTLHVLAPFFTSAFVRVPPPALGPVAFMEFWGYIQPGLGCLEGALPEEIKTCLNAYHLAFDGVLLPDISMESQSQSQRHSQSQSQFQSSDSSLKLQPLSAEGSRYSHSHQIRDIEDSAESNVISEVNPTQPQATPTRSILSRRRDIFSPEWPFRGHHPAPGPVDVHTPDSPVRSQEVTLPSDPVVPGSSWSVFVPSSPTAGKRVIHTDGVSSRGKRRAEARPDPRPAKRIKSNVRSHTGDTMGDAFKAGFPYSNSDDVDHTSISEHVKPAASDSSPLDRTPSLDDPKDPPTLFNSSRARLNPTEVPPRDTVQHDESTRDSTTTSPRPRSSPSEGSRPLLSPEVPLPKYSELRASPGSDDYAAWEAGLDMNEVQRITHGRAGSSFDGELAATIGEPSSSQLAEDALFSPNMREIVATGSEASLRHLGDAGSFETSSAPPDDRRDVPYVPDRSRTAPAASSRPSAPTTQAPLLRRAHTTSARIDVLQQVYAAVQADGSQMPVDEMLAATKLVHDIGGVLNERLLKRLGDGGNDGRHLG